MMVQEVESLRGQGAVLGLNKGVRYCKIVFLGVGGHL